MRHENSNIFFSSVVSEHYDVSLAEENFLLLSKNWKSYEYHQQNHNWKIANQLNLLAGNVDIHIDGQSLTELYSQPLGFQVESLVSHAYQLLWGSAFSQSFSKDFEIDIEETGVRFQLTRDGNNLNMSCNNDALADKVFKIDPLQYLAAVSEYYSTIVRTLFQTHKAFRANNDFVRAIPLIRFINGI